MAAGNRSQQYNRGVRWQKGPSKGVRWSIIVALLFFVYPVGIGFVLAKLFQDKQYYDVNGKRTAIVGWVFFGFGVMFTLASCSPEFWADGGESLLGGTIMTCLLFWGAGAVLIHLGNKYKRLGQMYNQYVTVILQMTDGSIERIARAVGQETAACRTNLQKLIEIGLLEGSYIDNEHGILVSPLIGRAVAAGYSVPKAKTVQCPNCGGSNTVIEGGENVCEFCGTYIEIK